jgi:hypothetical protein
MANTTNGARYHPQAPLRLKRMKRDGVTYRSIADRLKVNVRYVYNALVYGVKPENEDIARALGYEKFPYYYAWGNNEKRATMKGRRCRVLMRGEMNSCLIEFENGQKEIVSRNAVRKVRR